PGVGDTRFGGRAGVEIETVAEGERAAGRDRGVASAGRLSGIEVMEAKGVRGEEAVIAHVPRGGVAQVLRVIEDGDANGRAFHGSIVIYPISPRSPGRRVLDPRSGLDVAAPALDGHRI